MAKLVFLGTASAVPDKQHENTHLAVESQGRLVLVDCVGSPTVRLAQAGLKLDALQDLILTHFHPDHVSGVPSLLINAWLLGRRQPLSMYGLEPVLERMQRLLEFYEWETWQGFYPLHFQAAPAQENTLLINQAGLLVFTSPVCHMVPTLGLRFESVQTGGVVTYSCDTAPCEAVVRLAQGADVLIHEATGAYNGHSTAAQAGAIAQQAGAGRLYLIHYPPSSTDPARLIAEASQTYSGPVTLAEDFMELEF